MAILFRKIRKTLAEQNKAGKYLRYAMGEVILITIGILIAVQINAFKTYRQDRQTEEKVLLKLRGDLQKDTADFNHLIQIKHDQLANCHAILEFFAHPLQDVTDTAQFALNANRPFYFYIDNPHRTVFELAKSSGDLFKICDDNLVDTITVYFSDHDVSQFLQTTKTLSTEYMRDVYMTHHKFNPHHYTQQDISDFLHDFRMENYYLVMTTHLEIGIGLIKEKRARAISLMAQIDDALDQREK